MRDASVTFLITGLKHGGAETQLFRLAVGLKRRGWRVDVVSLLGRAAYSAPLEEHGIPVHHLGASPGSVPPGVLFRLHRLLKRLRPDALVTFMYHANVLGRMLGAAQRIPVVVASIRTPNFGGPLREAVERWTETLGTLTTTNSAFVARNLVEKKIVRPERLRVIHNGIATPEPPVAAEVRVVRAELSMSSEVFAWLAVGRLDEAKDYPTLLAAMHRLRSLPGPRQRLLIAGEGPERERLEALSAELGLTNTVTFLGFRSDVPRLLAGVDGFVASSAWEGMSNAVLEALAHGKPVVTTRVGGVDELIQDSHHGRVVRTGDPVALASALSEIMNLAADERTAMGERVRSHVMREFAEEKMVSEWETFLGELLRSAPGRRS